jgi:glycosyltransferase involved in cell wall biosynthesis
MTDASDRYPRVLVLATVSFNLEAGGGVTMTNLFRGWPSNRIAQIYSNGVNNKDKSVCRTYYHIPAVDRQFEIAEGRPLFGRSALSAAMRRGGARRLFRVTSQFQEAIAFARKFKPDVAYVRPMDKPSCYWWFCRDLCRLLDIPYVTHIMDDWPARYEHDTKQNASEGPPTGMRGSLKAARLRRSLQSLCDGAAANLAISPEMAAAFNERYKSRFTAFHNAVDVTHWEQKAEPRPSGTPGRDRPYVIRYLGAVVPDKELDSLKDIALATRRLADEGRKIRFEIHCGPAWNETVDTHLTDGDIVGRGAFLSQDELPGALSQADLLVLPMNFDERSMRYVGYSMQTKGPEYMASGTPILVYGPPSNPNVRYAKDARWAVAVDQHDPTAERLAHEIRSLMDDSDRSRRIGLHGRNIARTNHDVRAVHERFRATLHEAAESKR